MKRCGIDYVSSVEMAARWGISDRRVRVLCEKGQVAGGEFQSNETRGAGLSENRTFFGPQFWTPIWSPLFGV